MDSKECVNEMMDKVGLLKKAIGKYMNYHFKDLPLTGEQSRLLFIIHEHGHSQKEIAQFLHISDATLSVRIRRLEEAGYIIRKISPKDRRHSNIELTEKGIEYCKMCKAKMDHMRDVCARGLTQEDHQAVLHMIDVLITNIEKDLKEENDA